jgi:HK97 family phage prohead protease
MADRPFETRRNILARAEIREAAEGYTLDGYASTYNQPYAVGYFDERVLSSAFTRTMGRNPDVRLLVDHEGQPLARTASGTLTLDEKTPLGFRALAPLEPSDPDVQRVVPKMMRGDLGEMSFAFRVFQGGDEWDYSGERPLRTLREIDMNGGDVSLVTYPANPGTMASLRSDTGPQEACWTLAEAMLFERRRGRSFEKRTLRHLYGALDDLGLTIRDVPDLGALREARAQVLTALGHRAVGDSFNDTERALSDALQQKFGGADGDEPCDLWVMDAGPDWVVWCAYGDAGPGKGTWRMSYGIDGDSISFTGDPMQVIAQTTYEPVITGPDVAEQNSGIPTDLAQRLAHARQLRRTA